MLESQVIIFDKSGLYITELAAPNVSRSWKINERGEMTFNVSFEDVKMAHDILKFGNLIYVAHNKLPVWGGVIDPPRRWNVRDKSIEVKAYSGLYLLKFARMPVTFKPAAAPGEVFRQMISTARIDAYFKPNDIWGGGEVQKPEYHFGSVYDAVTNFCKTADVEFEFVPNIDTNGRMIFESNLYERMEYVSPIVLHEGKHIALTDAPLIEDGPIYNDVLAYGDGSSWGSRKTSTVIDETSIGEFGLRQHSISVNEKVLADITEGAKTELRDSKNPRNVFDIQILDVEGALEFARLGAIYNVEFYSCGFDGAGIGKSARGRIVGMNYEDNKKLLDVVMEEEYGAT